MSKWKSKEVKQLPEGCRQLLCASNQAEPSRGEVIVAEVYALAIETSQEKGTSEEALLLHSP